MPVFFQRVSGEILKIRYQKALKEAKGSLPKAAKIVGHSLPTFRKYALQFKLIKKHQRLVVTFRGKKKHFTEWSRELGIPVRVLYQRIRRRRMPVEKAFTLPYEFRDRKAA